MLLYGNFLNLARETGKFVPSKIAKRHLEIIQQIIPLLEPLQLSILPSMDMNNHMRNCSECKRRLMENDLRFDELPCGLNEEEFKAKIKDIIKDAVAHTPLD